MKICLFLSLIDKAIAKQQDRYNCYQNLHMQAFESKSE